MIFLLLIVGFGIGTYGWLVPGRLLELLSGSAPGDWKPLAEELGLLSCYCLLMSAPAYAYGLGRIRSIRRNDIVFGDAPAD